MKSSKDKSRFNFPKGCHKPKQQDLSSLVGMNSQNTTVAGKVLSSQKVLITSFTHKSEGFPDSVRRRSSPLHEDISSTSASLVKALQACMSTWSFGSPFVQIFSNSTSHKH